MSSLLKAEQISVFVENSSGKLMRILDTLAKLDIRALSLADTSDFGILRIITNDQEEAKKILASAGFTIGSTAVAAVELDDAPGALSRLLALLAPAKINVEYMYNFVKDSKDTVIMIIRFDKMEDALEIISRNGYKLFDTRALSIL